MPSESRIESDSVMPAKKRIKIPRSAWDAYASGKTLTDEGGGTSYSGMSREDFDALPFNEQIRVLGGLTLTPQDEGYADIKNSVGGEAGRNVWLTNDAMSGARPGDAEGYLNQGTKEYQGDGYFAHSEDQQTPGFQHKGHERFNVGKILAAAALPILGGAASSAMGLAGGGAMGTGAGVTGGLGAELTGSAFSSGGLSGLGAAATPAAGGVTMQNTGLSSLFQGQPALAPSLQNGGWEAALANAGGPTGAAPTGGLSSLGQTNIPGPLESIPNPGAAPTINPMSPMPSTGGGIGSSIGNFLKNPGNIARVGMGLASLGGASGSGPTSSGGSPTDASSIIDQMAQANRVNQNTPIGSRNWVKNADGTWTVNDTMSAPEQANFSNVQGMNADVTNMARQRLAALLAQPARARADAPIVIGGRTIGG